MNQWIKVISVVVIMTFGASVVFSNLIPEKNKNRTALIIAGGAIVVGAVIFIPKLFKKKSKEKHRTDEEFAYRSIIISAILGGIFFIISIFFNIEIISVFMNINIFWTLIDITLKVVLHAAALKNKTKGCNKGKELYKATAVHAENNVATIKKGIIVGI